MRWPRLNNRLAVREYAEAFERRFTRDRHATLFLEGDGTAVRMPDEEAAGLIAAMRASLREADAATPLAGVAAGYAMIGAALGAILLGAGLGLPGLGCALALPAALAVFLLGPGIGAIRLEAAWTRGMVAAREAMAGFERVPARDVRALAPPNRVRPVLEALGFLTAAMSIGLIAAYVTLPYYGRIGMDRALARAAPTVVFALVVLAFAARSTDAFGRQRVSEAAVADALAERRRRPFR